MTVVFDLLGAQNRDHGERGIARYVSSLAVALEALGSDAVDAFLVDPALPVPDRLEPLIRRGVVRPFDRFRPPDGATGGVYLIGSLFESDHGLDRVLPVWARSARWRTVAILYDLIPLRFHAVYLQDPVERSRYLARIDALRTVDHLLAISQASADDAVDLLGLPAERITVIGAGTDARFRPIADPAVDVAGRLMATVVGLRPGYLLFPTGIEPRKNNARLLAAYASLPAALRRRHQLVVMCQAAPAERASLEDEARRLGIQRDLLITGFVDEGTLVELYRGAELVVFPSRYEGFGLPVLEARRCGAPVICSDTSSLREVLPHPSARFDPEDVAAIADALRRSLGDPDERKRLRSLAVAPFTWERAAHLTGAVLRRGRRRAPQPHRRRLAVVTPLPPAASGIAAYASRLLPDVATEVDLTVFTDDPAPGDRTADIDGIEVRRTAELEPMERAGDPFDEVVYFLGNSEFHISALDLLRRRPGVVLLHDVRLTGLYNATFRHRPDALPDRTVGLTLARLYPGRYRPDLHELDTVEHDVASRFGILLVKEVAELATELLVHSPFAARLVELDCGRRPQVAYPLPLPRLPDPADTDTPARAGPGAVRRPSDGSGSPPVIGSFGIVSPVKRPHLLLGALRHLREQVPGVELRFVGTADPDTYREVLRAAADLGLSQAVSITGQLPEPEFLAEMAAVDVAVQLRGSSNGESSGAVADLMAAGVPTIVSDLGAMSDLPGDAVRKVAHDADDRQLARTVLEVLGDDRQRRALAAGAGRYAQANSYESAAKRFLQLVLDRG